MSEPDLHALDPYLREIWNRRASDLLLTVGAPALLRVDGALTPIDGEPFHAEQLDALVEKVLGDELTRRFRTDLEVDFSFGWGEAARFRANAFHQRGSAALSLRLIPRQIPAFDDVMLPEAARKLVELPQGLVLVTGPTGSGKSTTLASMIDAINQTRACHILTIEDPIEYVYEHGKSAVNQRELGADTLSFDRALRSALREDPDVLLVGEMRDTETIATTLTIAETGHLVFATLHTNDAAQTLDRIVDVFPSDQQSQIRVQLAGSLQAIVSQRLVPRRGPGGGRVAAFEVMIATHAVRNIVRDGRTNQLRNQITTGAQHGMTTLETSLSELVASGLVDYDEALLHTLVPNEVRRPTGPVPEPPTNVPRIL
ncbi:MAG: type IV pilus twitching motility protein PilT [Acidimicrobiia bacterium]